MYCLKMESQTTINLPDKTSNNKDLPKKKVNRKKNNKETKIEKPILCQSWFYCIKDRISKGCKFFWYNFW